jgi:hypothetical protein
VHHPRHRLLRLPLPRLQLLLVERCHTTQPFGIVQEQQRQVLPLLWTYCLLLLLLPLW